MKKIILIGGDLAAGKSTYSHIIGDRFNIPVFNKDIVKEILAEEIVTHNREENRQLSVACFRIFRYMVEQNISPVVMESNFKPCEMKELTPVLLEHGYDILSIRLIGTDEIVHNRFMERLASRPAVHKSQDLSRLDDYLDVVNELREVEFPGEVITLNVDDFSYQKDESILNKIKEFLER